MSLRRIVTPVRGSRWQPGDWVMLGEGSDPTFEGDPGMEGRVVGLSYRGIPGESYPADPMILVEVQGMGVLSLWTEELEAV